ncbi:WSC domain-containing protein [Mycena rebaudengoi]|nr:WSC domain-containing protein [Mycena rebaudengoi]
MTIEKCIAFCEAGGFGFAGVEFGSECYCDHAPQASGLPVALTECNVPCAGDATEFCGAGNRLNLFTDGSALPTLPQEVGPWEYQGCFADSINPRTLPNNIATADGKVTVESCITACRVNGFSVAGMEFGLECWCANALPTALALGDDQCRMACVAEPTEFCGGFSRIQVYLLVPPTTPTSDTPVPPTETAPTSASSLPPVETPDPTSEEPLPPTETAPTSDTPLPPVETPDPTSEEPLPPTETPAPTSDEPLPPVETPDPTSDEPLPPVETPAPTSDEPLPPVETPAPTSDEPLPPVETPPSDPSTDPDFPTDP